MEERQSFSIFSVSDLAKKMYKHKSGAREGVFEVFCVRACDITTCYIMVALVSPQPPCIGHNNTHLELGSNDSGHSTGIGGKSQLRYLECSSKKG